MIQIHLQQTQISFCQFMNFKYLLILCSILQIVRPLARFIKMQNITYTSKSLRSIHISNHRLVAGFDDGNIITYAYNGTQFQTFQTETEAAQYVRYLAVNENYNIIYAGEQNNVFLYTFKYNGTHYQWTDFDGSVTGTKTKDLSMSEDSQYFVQSIFGYGAYVYKHNGVNFASAYSITICSDILKGTLSEDILAIGCGSGNVYVYRLDASSSTLIASFTDHTSAITGVTVNMTIGYLVTCAVDYKVFIYEWDGSTFQNFQQVTNTTHAYSVKVFSDSEYVYLLIGWTQSYVDIYYLDQPGGASTFTILQQYYEGLPSATYSVEVSPDLKFMSFSTSDSSAFQIFMYYNINFTEGTRNNTVYNIIEGSDNSTNSTQSSVISEEVHELSDRIEIMRDRMNNLEAYVIAVAVLFGIVSVGVIYYTIDAIIRRSKKNKKMHPEEKQFEEKGKMKEENVTNITKNNTIDPVFKKDEIESLDYVVQEEEDYKPRQRKKRKREIKQQQKEEPKVEQDK